jgi:general secretion pathway protein N
MQNTEASARWRRVSAIIGAALVAALAVLATQAPASLLARAVQAGSQGRIELREVSGTVWRGAGAVVLGAGSGDAGPRTRLPGEIAWRIAPWALLLGTLDLTLSDPALLDAPVVLHLDRHRIGSLGAGRLRMPAEALVGLGAPWNTIQPGGELVLEWDTLHLAPMNLRGELRGEWSDASSRLCPIVPFGHYRVTAEGVYPGAQVRLETLAGPMEMSGDGTIADGNRLHFRGTARVQPGTDAALATQLSGLISLLGPRDGDAASLQIGT